MTLIQVLGTGCAKCKQLAVNAEAAARALNLEYRLEKVTDLQAIMAFKIMTTPGLVINGVVKVNGKVPSVDEIKKMLA
jgi:small redox-active disulfide protein 2